MSLHPLLVASILALSLSSEGRAQPELVSVPDDPLLLGTSASHGSGHCRLSADGLIVGFQSAALQLVPGDSNGLTDTFARNLGTGGLVRLSTMANGLENPRGGSFALISGDAQRTAFLSAVDPRDGTVYDHSHLWWMDRTTGEVVLATRRPDGGAANGPGSSPELSHSGDFLTFYSNATDLVAGGTDRVGHLYVFDANNGEVHHASTSATGVHANAISYQSGVSDDGRYVAFESNASNLVPDDTNGARDIFVKDLHTGAIDRISRGWNGEQSNGGSDFLGISPDGDLILFTSSASNLVPNDTNGSRDIFLHSRAANATMRVNLGPGGVQVNGSNDASMSADGSVIVFTSTDATIDGPTGGRRQLFVRYLATGVVKRLTSVATGVVVNVRVSADGSVACFQATDDTLTPGDVNDDSDVYAINLATGELVRASESPAPVPMTSGDDHSMAADISEDGELIAFQSDARLHAASFASFGRLHGGQILVRDMRSNSLRLASARADGSPSEGYNEFPRISAGGRYVAWTSYDDALSPDDANGEGDIYRKDLVGGTLELVSRGPGGAAAGGYEASISGDGSRIAFVGPATTAGGFEQVYLWEEGEGIRVVSTASDGTPGETHAMYPEISRDGRYIVYVSGPTDGTDGGDTSRLWLHDVEAGTNVAIALPGSVGDSGVEQRPALSGDGSRIAFIFNDDEQYRTDLYIAEPSRGQMRRLPLENLPAAGAGPVPHTVALSADGSHLAFWLMDFATTTSVLWRYDIDRDDYVRLLENDDSDFWHDAPRLSADGTALAFSHPEALADDDINGDMFDVYRIRAARDHNLLFADGFD